MEGLDSRTSLSQPGENDVNTRAQAQGVQAHFQALVEALVLRDGFDDFYEGPFDSCFGHLHEVCYSLLDWLKGPKPWRSREPKRTKFQAILRSC